MRYYYLDDDKNPLPCPDLLNWTVEEHEEYATWFNENRRVKETTLNGYWVSTVFLGLDHQFGGNETPVLWETMITFGGNFIDYQRRYMSYEDAERGHDKIVELMSNELTKSEILG